jgi:predicted AlkP superfamily pyrophosphatase or phosphodiesterase
MSRRRVLLLILLIGWWAAAGHAQSPVTDLKPTVILISLDGWRWDYAKKYAAPTLSGLIKRGVSGPLIPSFPSKTFPNHYTIVTGLYPGHHGIVANAVKDPETGRRLTMSNRKEVQSPMWWGGEPLWVTVQRAGQVAAPLFWPGSEAPIMGPQAKFWLPFNEEITAGARIDRVLRWLDLPVNERPTFLSLYFSDVDGAGHESGPESQDVATAVRRVDGYLNRLMKGLSKRHLEHIVNIVVVSDHGMAEASTNRVVVLDDYLSLAGLDIVDLNPTLGIFPPAGREEDVYRSLTGANPHLRVFRKAETPPEWHYRDHPRIPPIVGVVDEGWQVLRRTTLTGMLEKGQKVSGVHGYDPTVAVTMRGIFVATGPAFKSGVTVEPFENVHLYDAFCEILGVTPARNDGDPKVARLFLK